MIVCCFNKSTSLGAGEILRGCEAARLRRGVCSSSRAGRRSLKRKCQYLLHYQREVEITVQAQCSTLCRALRALLMRP